MEQNPFTEQPEGRDAGSETLPTVARVVLAGNTSNRYMPRGPMSLVGAALKYQHDGFPTSAGWGPVNRSNMASVRRSWRQIARMNGIPDGFGRAADLERGDLTGVVIYLADRRPADVIASERNGHGLPCATPGGELVGHYSRT